MANKLDERIGSLEERLKELKGQQQKRDARKRTIETRKSRRDDTRRKILVGAIVLAKVEQGVLDEATLMSWLEGALTREDDRKLFDFESLATVTDSSG